MHVLVGVRVCTCSLCLIFVALPFFFSSPPLHPLPPSAHIPCSRLLSRSPPTFYPTFLTCPCPPLSHHATVVPLTVSHAHTGIQRRVQRASARSGRSSTAVPMPRPCARRAPSRSREAASVPPLDAQSGLLHLLARESLAHLHSCA